MNSFQVILLCGGNEVVALVTVDKDGDIFDVDDDEVKVEMEEEDVDFDVRIVDSTCFSVENVFSFVTCFFSLSTTLETGTIFFLDSDVSGVIDFPIEVAGGLEMECEADKGNDDKDVELASILIGSVIPTEIALFILLVLSPPTTSLTEPVLL